MNIDIPDKYLRYLHITGTVCAVLIILSAIFGHHYHRRHLVYLYDDR